MTDRLLHPNLVIDLLCEVADPRCLQLLSHARDSGDALWLPVAALEPMVSTLASRIGGDIRQARGVARSRLKQFAANVTWLAAPAGDGNLLDSDDLLDQQVASGLERLGPGATLLVHADDAVKFAQVATTLPDLVAKTKTPGVPFIDLAFQQRRIRDRIEAGLFGVLAHGKYIGGPEIDALEAKLADFVGVRHALAISNGTDALLIAMMAAGVRAGDEVVTSPFTFAATGEMIHLLGARPVYVDIDPVSYNLDANLIEAALSERTRVIMPVSIFGQCADMEAINQLASRHGIRVIEDGAQSFGATFRERRSGGLSHIGCTSFFPSKPLGGYGDSGACFSDDDELADAMRRIRDHGQSGRYHHTQIGINGRMSSFQASVLLAKLELFEEEISLRAQVAARYDRLFAERGRKLDKESLVIPEVMPGNTSVYAQYSLLVRNREAVQRRLSEQGVPSAVHYPVPLNRQPAMADDSCHVPVSEDISSRVLSIPMHPYLDEAQQARVVDAVVDAVASV
jgi:UDP-2-acetamido-2-deoxy-ribo-hexuluronate aminotransferase